MISAEFDTHAVRAIEDALSRLNGSRIIPAIMSAQKRAATAGRMEGRRRIRQIYTIKAGEINKRAVIRQDRGALETLIDIKGPFEPVSQYKSRENARGIFVEIKKGKGNTVPRSFNLSGRFVAREGPERLPIHGLYGPAVPQQFGNPEVVEAMEKRATEVYEQRLLHELERLVGV